jgi:P22_AR N-terminal domain
MDAGKRGFTVVKDESLVLLYAGLNLTVVKNADGVPCVPLKPIADVFGLEWVRQHKRVSEADCAVFLGTCVVPSFASGQSREVVCIRLDRVAAYLMTITIGQVRAQGNVKGADFLVTKRNEWADVLHDYEELGIAINPHHARSQEILRKQRYALAHLLGQLDKTRDKAARGALAHLVKIMAGELGVPYQPDLLDGAK